MGGIKEFYEALAKDEQMQDRAKKSGDGEKKDETEVLIAIVEFAAKEGYSFTVDEAKAYLTANAKKELSDDDLAVVTGGGFCVIGGGGGNEDGCVCILGGMGTDQSGNRLAPAQVVCVVIGMF